LIVTAEAVWVICLSFSGFVNTLYTRFNIKIVVSPNTRIIPIVFTYVAVEKAPKSRVIVLIYCLNAFN